MGDEWTTGIRVVATVVVVLLIAAVLVVLARVGLWRQALVLEPRDSVACLGAGRSLPARDSGGLHLECGEYEWWLYGPVSLVIAVLALVVAGSGGNWPRFHRPQRTLLSH